MATYPRTGRAVFPLAVISGPAVQLPLVLRVTPEPYRLPLRAGP